MKTGLGIGKKYRLVIAFINLIRFTIRKYLLGFDTANLFLQRVEKISLQLILKKYGAKIGENCDIETGLIFHNCKNYSNLNIGNNCHIGKNCFFDLRDKIILNDNVVISMQCTFITHMDMTKSCLSTLYPSLSKKIVIHENCYIGAKSMLQMGVELGECSLVASNSMVNKNVEKFTVVGGIPVRLIRRIIL